MTDNKIATLTSPLKMAKAISLENINNNNDTIKVDTNTMIRIE